MNVRHWCPARWHTVLLSLSQSLSVTNPPCLCLSISQVHFVNNECNWISLAFEKLTFTSQLSFPGEVSLPKAFWLQLCLHQLHQLYWEYSPGTAAVPFSIHSEFHLKDSVVKLESDCPYPSELFVFFFHIKTVTSTEVQNQGAEVLQGEPVLDNPCFYASK